MAKALAKTTKERAEGFARVKSRDASNKKPSSLAQKGEVDLQEARVKATVESESSMESNSEPQIVAIIIRNAQGQLERRDETRVDCGDLINLVPVLSGLVAVIGPVFESDRSELEILLKDL